MPGQCYPDVADAGQSDTLALAFGVDRASIHRDGESTRGGDKAVYEDRWSIPLMIIPSSHMILLLRESHFMEVRRCRAR